MVSINCKLQKASKEHLSNRRSPYPYCRAVGHKYTSTLPAVARERAA
jgi:hypothetical protein